MQHAQMAIFSLFLVETLRNDVHLLTGLNGISFTASYIYQLLHTN